MGAHLWYLPQPREENSTAQHVYRSGLIRAGRRGVDVVAAMCAFVVVVRTQASGVAAGCMCY